MVYLQIFCASTRNTSRLKLEVILFGLRPFRASVKSKLCRYLGTRVRVLLHGSPPTEYISLNRLTSLRSLYSILQLKRQTGFKVVYLDDSDALVEPRLEIFLFVCFRHFVLSSMP